MEEQEDKLDFDLEAFEREKLYARVRKQNRMFLFINIGLSLLGSIVLEPKTEAFIGHFLALPILSFILGLIPAAIPSKKLPFKKRYLNTSLFLLILLNAIAVIANILEHFV
jgi:hypothetical protein